MHATIYGQGNKYAFYLAAFNKCKYSQPGEVTNIW
jgi:hypothetical protein